MPPHQGQLSNKASQHPGQTLSLLPSQNCRSSCLFFRSLPCYRCGLLVPSVCSTLVEAVKSSTLSYNKDASFRLVLCRLESTKAMAGNDGGVIAWIQISILTWTHKQNGDKERQHHRVFLVKKGIVVLSLELDSWVQDCSYFLWPGSKYLFWVNTLMWSLEDWDEGDFFFYRVKSVSFDTVSDKLVKYW